MWNRERKRTGSGKQELQVCCKVGELCEFNITADEFIYRFKNELKTIRKESCYLAEWRYQAKKIDENNIEIWKIKSNDDPNYLMYKLTKGEHKPGPFDHL